MGNARSEAHNLMERVSDDRMIAECDVWSVCLVLLRVHQQQAQALPQHSTALVVQPILADGERERATPRPWFATW